MDIAVIGAGYVGLVTGAVFAELGNNVTCTDRDAEKIATLNEGRMTFYEPGLEEMVLANVQEKRLRFTTDTGGAVRCSEIIFIAVGTPPAENGETDLSQVEDAADEIGRNLNGYKIVVNKSTVPVGTGDFVKEIIDRRRPQGVECDVVSNPEFLSEGTAIKDAMEPDRIVIGAPNRKVALKLIELYSAIERPTVITSVRSAEIIKYASNAFLATKISFINSVANLCERAGADIEEVARGMGLDERIGPKFLHAGIGFGGSCFPKDTESLMRVSSRFGYDFEILRGTINVNRAQPPAFVEKVEKALGGIKDKTLGVLGLSFKPGTDDLRDSVSVNIARLLLSRGAIVRAYDPMAMEKCRKLLPELKYCDDMYSAAKGTDALLVLTEWNRFRQINFSRLRQVMRGRHVFDGRNIYDPKILQRYKFIYHGIGRGGVEAGGQGSAQE
ncbi:MAG: UDP-glucose/GDP-mannose dehydrogenase family protein [bacterium]